MMIQVNWGDIMRFTIKCRPRVPWNVFDQVCSFGLEVSNLLLQYACCNFYRNTHIVSCNMHAICILWYNIDSFLLNQKGLVDISILLKNIYCKMHIARSNMRIVLESILPLTLTYVQYYLSTQGYFFGVRQPRGNTKTLVQNGWHPPHTVCI